MANSILTPTAVTREALRVLHQKLTFIGSINRQYDDSYAKSGAKIGDSLKIRLPNEYTTGTGNVMTAQDTSESSVTMTIGTQRWVAMNFTAAELTLSLDDFSSRVIDPAMARLAANIEADAYSMYKNVYNLSDEDGTAFTFLSALKGRKVLNDNLAPLDNNRTAMLSTAHNLKLVDAVKGLFHDSAAIKAQYREGMVGRTAGFDFYENTHVSDHTTGTAVEGDTLYNVNGANQTGASITVDTGATTFLIGDVVTFAGCNAVHPETKTSTGALKQFVITANSGANATTLAISPAIVTSGPTQNCSASPTTTGAVSKIGAGASELLNSSMVYHKDAFAIAFADLLMPKGVDFAAREQYDGISMRIVRQYDVVNDKLPCRVDVLYGYKAIRPELACRLHADG